ncbi:MAG: hypothetical protein ACI4VC_04635 [Clostridia bacterium]
MNLTIEIAKFTLLSLGIVIIAKYLLVPVLRKISQILNLGPKASGNIAGFATSVPELLTVAFSAAAGFIGTGVYNVLSSNVINSIQYIFSIYLNKNQKFLNNKAIKIDLFLVIITIFIPIGLLTFHISMDTNIVIIFVLLLALFYYINYNAHKLYLEKEDKEILQEEIEEEKKEYRFKRKNKKMVILYWIYLILIAISLYVIGELLSASLTNLSNLFGLPEFLLGILLGVITSIPELITFIEAQRKEKQKRNDEANKLGVIEATNNLLTSNILNIFAIQSLGIIIYTIFG